MEGSGFFIPQHKTGRSPGLQAIDGDPDSLIPFILIFAFSFLNFHSS